MATIYAVLLHVDEKQLPTVLGVLAGNAKLVSVTPTEEAKAEKKKKQQHYVDGKRDKGISGEDLLLQAIAKEQRAFTIKELEEVFLAHRFSGNSVSPVLNRLIQAEKIRKVGAGAYCLKGTVLKFGAS